MSSQVPTILHLEKGYLTILSQREIKNTGSSITTCARLLELIKPIEIRE